MEAYSCCCFVCCFGFREGNFFAGLQNPGIHCRADQWVPQRNYFVSSTRGRMRRANCSFGFGLESLEGASVLRYGRCCSTGLLVTV